MGAMSWTRLSDEPRERPITLYLSTTTAGDLAAAAFAAGVSRTELARWLVRRGLDALTDGTFQKPEPVIVEDDDEPAEPPKPAPKRRTAR